MPHTAAWAQRCCDTQSCLLQISSARNNLADRLSRATQWHCPAQDGGTDTCACLMRKQQMRMDKMDLPLGAAENHTCVDESFCSCLRC